MFERCQWFLKCPRTRGTGLRMGDLLVSGTAQIQLFHRRHSGYVGGSMVVQTLSRKPESP